MTILKRMRKGLLATIGAALLFGMLTAAASAAFTAPFSAYGTTGVNAGDTVTAMIDGAVVGTTTVTADGAWVIQITEANVGDVITFTVNGAEREGTLIAEEGGAPGVGLNASVPAATGLDLSTAAPTTPPAPPPAPTGNAGLVGSAGGSMLLVLMLGVVAAVTVAGARTATRRG